MSFTPEKPAKPTDLYCLLDDEYDEAYTIMYECDEGEFYRHNGEWMEMTEDQVEDFNNLNVIFVTPAFTPVFDEAESEDLAIGKEDVKQYEAKVSI